MKMKSEHYSIRAGNSKSDQKINTPDPPMSALRSPHF